MESESLKKKQQWAVDKKDTMLNSDIPKAISTHLEVNNVKEYQHATTIQLLLDKEYFHNNIQLLLMQKLQAIGQYINCFKSEQNRHYTKTKNKTIQQLLRDQYKMYKTYDKLPDVKNEIKYVIDFIFSEKLQDLMHRNSIDLEPNQPYAESLGWSILTLLTKIPMFSQNKLDQDYKYIIINDILKSLADGYKGGNMIPTKARNGVLHFDDIRKMSFRIQACKNSHLVDLFRKEIIYEICEFFPQVMIYSHTK